MSVTTIVHYFPNFHLIHLFLLLATFPAVVSCSHLSVTSGAPGGLTLQLSAANIEIGTRAVYSCSNTSYHIVGVAERVCGADGNWTGEKPRCEC